MKTILLTALFAIGLAAAGIYFAADATVSPEQSRIAVCEQHAALRASGGNEKNGKNGKACESYSAESPRSGSGLQGTGMRQGKIWRVYL